MTDPGQGSELPSESRDERKWRLLAETRELQAEIEQASERGTSSRIPDSRGTATERQEELASDLERRKRELQTELRKVESALLEGSGDSQSVKRSNLSHDRVPSHDLSPTAIGCVIVYAFVCLGMVWCGLMLIASPFGGPFEGLLVEDSSDPLGASLNWVLGSIAQVIAGIALLVIASVIALLGGVIAAVTKGTNSTK